MVFALARMTSLLFLENSCTRLSCIPADVVMKVAGYHVKFCRRMCIKFKVGIRLLGEPSYKGFKPWHAICSFLALSKASNWHCCWLLGGGGVSGWGGRGIGIGIPSSLRSHATLSLMVRSSSLVRSMGGCCICGGGVWRRWSSRTAVVLDCPTLVSRVVKGGIIPSCNDAKKPLTWASRRAWGYRNKGYCREGGLHNRAQNLSWRLQKLWLRRLIFWSLVMSLVWKILEAPNIVWHNAGRTAGTGWDRERSGRLACWMPLLEKDHRWKKLKTLPLLPSLHSLSHWQGTPTHWGGSPPQSHWTHHHKRCDGSVCVSHFFQF